ncbi:MAG: hypothetical protein ACI9G1_003981 [Pirellulaceae bacterium]|jgi:hypothetical protein
MKLQCQHCSNTIEVSLDRLQSQIECSVCGRTFDADSTANSGPRESALETSHPWGKSLMSTTASCLIHTMLLLLCALFAWQLPVPEDEYAIQPLPVAPSAQETEVQKTSFQEVEAAVERDLDTTDIDPTQNYEIGGQAGAADSLVGDINFAIGSDTTSNVDLGISGGSASDVSFMGVAAQGRYLCIIADCSGSMEGRKLDHVKREIFKTVDQMGGTRLCKIIFFHSQPKPYENAAWRNPKVDRPNIQQWVTSIRSDGGTEPLPALRLALNAERRPDEIWLMSDGEFDAIDAQLRDLNDEDPKTTIHTISFLSKEGEVQLRAIAKDSGGTYHHVSSF